MYEKGIRITDFNTLATYASYFNVSTDYLLGLTLETKIENQGFIVKASKPPVSGDKSFLTYSMPDNSMREAEIIEKATVLIQLNEPYNTGQIVLVKIKNNTYLRRLIIKNNIFILKAENSDYESFIFINENDFKILGKAIEVKTNFLK